MRELATVRINFGVMDNFNKKEIIQAILIADNNVENFRPLSDSNSTVSN